MIDEIMLILLKRIRDIIIGSLCLLSGIFMVVTNNYNNIIILLISIIAFLYAIRKD